MEEIGVTQRGDALWALPAPVCHSPELSPTHLGDEHAAKY